MKREKFIISLVLIMVLVLVIGNVYSLATEPTVGTGNSTTITANTSSTTNNTTNNTNAGTNSNVSATVNSANTANNTSNNTSAYNNTSSNSASLPKAGTQSSVVFIVLGFVASAIYAYKKVTDYNV